MCLDIMEACVEQPYYHTIEFSLFYQFAFLLMLVMLGMFILLCIKSALLDFGLQKAKRGEADRIDYTGLLLLIVAFDLFMTTCYGMAVAIDPASINEQLPGLIFVYLLPVFFGIEVEEGENKKVVRIFVYEMFRGIFGVNKGKNEKYN